MCTVILRVVYQAQAEPTALIPCDTEAAATERLESLKKLETVASVTVFTRGEKHERFMDWKTTIFSDIPTQLETVQ